MRKESTTIQKCNSRLTALGLNSDAAFHRSKLILKIYRDVVWVLSERAEELQETDKRRVLSYIGRVSREEMRAIDDALQVSLDIHIPEEMEAP